MAVCVNSQKSPLLCDEGCVCVCVSSEPQLYDCMLVLTAQAEKQIVLIRLVMKMQAGHIRGP